MKRRMGTCIRRLGFLFFVAVAFYGCQKTQKVQDAGPSSLRNLPVSLEPTAPAGSPAIKLRTTGNQAFTVDDAKQYVATHRLRIGLAKGGKPKVLNAEFMTSKEASQRWDGLTTGLSDDYQVCYVELEGPVVAAGPPGTKVTYNKVVLIFDAHTGNIIIEGGRP